MTKPKSRSIVSIRLPSRLSRFVLLIPPVLAFAFAVFVVRWYIGNTVAEYTAPTDENAVVMAQLAVRWAPSDAFTHWRLGSLRETDFGADNLQEAVREYEAAVSLSPNDYRYWMELGDGLQAAGDEAGAERALRRAVELAPAYTQPRWFLGNALLRAGKTDEAFAQLVPAAVADDQMRAQILNLAWQVFGGDVETISRTACPNPRLRAQFAVYLVKQGRFGDAIRMWEGLSAQDRETERDSGSELLQSLLNAQQFNDALHVMRGISFDAHESAQAEQVWNGSFETSFAGATVVPFHWNFTSQSQAQIAVDSGTSHTGHNSLRIVFSAANRLDDIPVSQIVAVVPGVGYRLEVYARTRDLNSGSTPQITVRDASDKQTLAQSAPLPTGTNDWEKITIDFKAGPKTQGIIIGLSRAACEEKQLCPIFGYAWYDDFNLQRSNGARASR